MFPFVLAARRGEGEGDCCEGAVNMSARCGGARGRTHTKNNEFFFKLVVVKHEGCLSAWPLQRGRVPEAEAKGVRYGTRGGGGALHRCCVPGNGYA